ncbi:DUF29 domain-containing protein [Acidithiobacillus montserratensis]|uniref:DUF29 domain-containing protein n=1 Tax=Acidithiobacillus montserratensis TaxID=2729135 RepID=A0ACD5HDN9_9PROT|nr:DUF29 domain-containing protein [Acidithiobacillus montserratensis]
MATARQLEQSAANLYSEDFLAWIDAQAQSSHARQASGLDWDNLLKELESMGRSEKNALRSHLRVLLMHLMKWQWQPQKTEQELGKHHQKATA